MARPDAATVVAEFNTDAALAKLALRIGRERIACGDLGTSRLPAEKRKPIAQDLQQVVDQFDDMTGFVNLNHRGDEILRMALIRFENFSNVFFFVISDD